MVSAVDKLSFAQLVQRQQQLYDAMHVSTGVETSWPVSSPLLGDERIESGISSLDRTITGYTFELLSPGSGSVDIAIGHGPRDGSALQIGTLTVAANGTASVAWTSSTIPAGRTPWIQNTQASEIAGLLFSFALRTTS